MMAGADSKPLDFYESDDPVTAMLKQGGFSIHNHYLSGTSLVTGGRVQLMDCELVYRVDPDDTVMIVFYRRTSGRTGLKNSFRDLIAFCALVANSVPGIRYISGKADPLLRNAGDNIRKERLLAMYCRHIGTELRDGWLYFDLDDYRHRESGTNQHHLRWIDRVLKKD